MKKLGIIGGAGPLASALLYEMLIHESYSLGRQVPEIVLLNFPFTRGLSLNEGRANEKTIHAELDYCVQFLANNGVKLAILACNTLHLFLKQDIPSSIKFYSLPDLVLNQAQRRHHHRLLILGTQNTCHSNLYQSKNIEAIYPSSSDQMKIDDVINRVLDGKILKEDSELVEYVINTTLREKPFDGVVLGCTDFPVLHHHHPIFSTKPIYDSIKIPAQTLAGFI